MFHSYMPVVLPGHTIMAPMPHIKTHAVVVENPPTLDDHGNEVTSIAVGMQKAG